MKNRFFLTSVAVLALLGETQSQEIMIGTGLICDTYELAERVATSEMPGNEILEVNAEAGFYVCDVATIAYSIIEEYGLIQDAMGNPHYIAKILVHGIGTASDEIAPTPPLEVYTYFTTKEVPDLRT